MAMIRRATRVAVCLAVLLALSSLPAAACDTTVASALEDLLKETCEADAPGAAVIATRGGETLFRHACGLADLEHGIPLTPDMVFRLGSITKQFTAVAILMLEQEGKLKVSDEITRYLPDYPTHGKKITVEHLLTHTSGIPSYTAIPGWMAEKIRLDLDDEEMLAGWKELPLEFDPGTRFAYNNSGYFMLGTIIEAISGMEYGAFIEERIFKPLGMTSSYYDSETRIVPKRVRGYGRDESGEGYANANFLDMDQPGAAGGLMSTVDDLTKWDASLYTDQLLSAEARQRLWTAHTLSDGEATGYGYGWGIGEHGGKKIIQHSGGIFGFSTNSIRIPEESFYVAVLTNGGPVAPGPISEKAARVCLGEPAAGYERVEVDAKDLERLVGVYRVDEETTRVVTVEDGKLYTQRNDGPKIEAFPIGDDEFVYDVTTARVAFITRDGEVQGMEMHRWATPVEFAERTDEAIPEGPEVAEVDPAIYEEYKGKYQLMPNFVLSVWPEDGKLMTRATGQGSIEIMPESETVFFNSMIGARITFVRKDGEVTHLILEQAGQRIEAKRLDK